MATASPYDGQHWEGLLGAKRGGAGSLHRRQAECGRRSRAGAGQRHEPRGRGMGTAGRSTPPAPCALCEHSTGQLCGDRERLCSGVFRTSGACSRGTNVVLTLQLSGADILTGAAGRPPPGAAASSPQTDTRGKAVLPLRGENPDSEPRPQRGRAQRAVMPHSGPTTAKVREQGCHHELRPSPAPRPPQPGLPARGHCRPRPGSEAGAGAPRPEAAGPRLQLRAGLSLPCSRPRSAGWPPTRSWALRGAGAPCSQTQGPCGSARITRLLLGLGLRGLILALLLRAGAAGLLGFFLCLAGLGRLPLVEHLLFAAAERAA